LLYRQDSAVRPELKLHFAVECVAVVDGGVSFIAIAHRRRCDVMLGLHASLTSRDVPWRHVYEAGADTHEFNGSREVYCNTGFFL